MVADTVQPVKKVLTWKIVLSHVGAILLGVAAMWGDMSGHTVGQVTDGPIHQMIANNPGKLLNLYGYQLALVAHDLQTHPEDAPAVDSAYRAAWSSVSQSPAPHWVLESK